MRKAITILLTAITCSAGEFAPPLWSAWYWASTNGVDTGTVSVARIGGTHGIYTNGSYCGVRTSEINQSQAMQYSGHATQTTFRAEIRGADGRYYNADLVRPNRAENIMMICWGTQTICPPSGYTNVWLGTTNAPFAGVCTSSNSLWVGQAHIGAVGSALSIDGLYVDSPGITSKGKIKSKAADIENEDSLHGVVMPNAQGHRYRFFAMDNGQWGSIQISASPEKPWAWQTNQMHKARETRKKLREDYPTHGHINERMRAMLEWYEVTQLGITNATY